MEGEVEGSVQFPARDKTLLTAKDVHTCVDLSNSKEDNSVQNLNN
jgi:hypothetical protein